MTTSIRDIRTVGLILGPYRNLTTLTASALSLHPECQVLNHGGPRLLKGRRDFIRRGGKRRLDRFCQAAIEASTSGRRGDYGGSIRLSHAFDREEMQQLYQARYDDRDVKDSIKVLVWKESAFVTNRIRSEPGRIVRLVHDEPRLRFLMPVRHPFDCAQSNVRTGHATRIIGADPEDVTSVLDRIVEMIGWFATLMASYPDRFFMFYENDDSQTIADGLIRTLCLGEDPQWRSALTTAFAIQRSQYEYPSEIREAFNESVRHHLAELPEVAERLDGLVRS